MPDQNPKRSTVRRGVLRGKSAPETVTYVQAVCTTGAQSPVVQGSPAMVGALGALQTSVTSVQQMVQAKADAAQALKAATSALTRGLAEVSRKLAVYEVMVDDTADGDEFVINQAGLSARDIKTPPSALEQVIGVRTATGKSKTQAIVSWPVAKGATAYAIEVNWTPSDPNGVWTALPSGSSHRRVIVAPSPGAQFLVRVAALASDGQQTPWSTFVLATAA